jgi:hypothetical protein
MEDVLKMTDNDLENAQMAGAAMYLRAYLHRMSRKIGVPLKDIDPDDIDEMALSMVPAINHATTAMWGALMKDTYTVAQAVEKFQRDLEKLERR